MLLCYVLYTILHIMSVVMPYSTMQCLSDVIRCYPMLYILYVMLYYTILNIPFWYCSMLFFNPLLRGQGVIPPVKDGLARLLSMDAMGLFFNQHVSQYDNSFHNNLHLFLLNFQFNLLLTGCFHSCWCSLHSLLVDHSN